MNFKTTLCAALLPVLLAGSASVFAEDQAPEKVTVTGGHINFEGAVVAAPCAIDNDSMDQTVSLGQVTSKMFKTAGDTSSFVPFSIKLTGCDLSGTDGTGNYTKASIVFKGDTAQDNAELLAVSGKAGAANDKADGIGIQIRQNGTAAKFDGATALTPTLLANGENEVKLTAGYISFADAVTAGTANATADFSVTYE